MFKKSMCIISCLSVFLIFTGLAAAGAIEQKIAVAAAAQEESSHISMAAGRAPFFLLFDGKGVLLEKLANPYSSDAGRAGPSAAAFLAGKKVTVLIAGRVGGKMANALKIKNIHYIEKQGVVIDSVREVIHEE